MWSNYSRVEQSAFNEDLERYQRHETNADLREERIKDRVKYLMEEGQEYYPFTTDHIFEALSEVGGVDGALIAAGITTCAKIPDNMTLDKIGMQRIISAIIQYWKFLARREAERLED